MRRRDLRALSKATARYSPCCNICQSAGCNADAVSRSASLQGYKAQADLVLAHLDSLLDGCQVC